MGTLHHLIAQHGKDRARELVLPEERPLLDIAQAVMADEHGEISTTYSGFCLLTSLPHKRLADDQTWRREGYRVSITVEPGTLPVSRTEEVRYGIPYGARARLLLIYMQSRAIQTQSRVVEMGASMNEWLGRMGIDRPGGETYRAIQEQIRRIAACRLTFYWDDEDVFRRANIVEGGRGLSVPMMKEIGREIGQNPAQKALWQPVIEIGDTFYKALAEHPVPLAEAAVRALRDKSMSLDIYIWLAYRLHSLKKSQPITWAALNAQFGGYKLVRQFKPHFVQALSAALAAYPEANVEVDDGGIILKPSRPPIARLTA